MNLRDKLRDWLYASQLEKHVERWQKIGPIVISSTKLRILMYIGAHNHVTQADLTDYLLETKHFTRRTSSARKVRELLAKFEKEGYIQFNGEEISLVKPFNFVLKEEVIADSWILAFLALGIAFLLISFYESGFSPSTIGLIITCAGISLRILEDFLHTTRF